MDMSFWFILASIAMVGLFCLVLGFITGRMKVPRNESSFTSELSEGKMFKGGVNQPLPANAPRPPPGGSGT